jgi:thiamine biosynthesis lipoprotein
MMPSRHTRAAQTCRRRADPIPNPRATIARNLLPACIGVATLAMPALVRAEWVFDEQAIMGTAVRVELWHEDPAQGRAAIAVVMDDMRRIDAEMSVYKEDSEISRINAHAAEGPVQVSAELASLIARALEFSGITHGAFDITYASVGYLYDYRKHVKPDDATREKAVEAVDYHNVTVDLANSTVRFAKAGVRIDLGGIAKGYAVEHGAALLRERGIEHAIVTAGGDSRIIGDRLGRPWMVGIRDPRDKEGVITRIPLEDEAISTSGDYERFFEENGVRYHHILNPKTGKSADLVRSVTIIGPDGTSTDALTKGPFVLGWEKGLELIESLPGFETVVIDKDGGLHYSKGLRQDSP